MGGLINFLIGFLATALSVVAVVFLVNTVYEPGIANIGKGSLLPAKKA